MIIVKNRELLIPNHERYIGTTYDNETENRVFQVPRFSQRGVDLAALTFRLDIQYANEAFDTVLLDKEVGEAFIILIWRITSSTLQVPGTLYIGLRAVDDEVTVKWSSFHAALYVERHLNTPGNYTGSLTEIEQMEQDHQYMKGVVDELKANIDYAHDAEAWAKGTRSGSAVPSTDPTYHNNSKYYSEQANTKATQAANSATAAANSATQAAETVADTNTRFNNAVASVTSDTEVIDARVGADGTTYPVLKTRLDTEHTQLKSHISDAEDRLIPLDGIIALPTFERGSVSANNGVLQYISHAKRIRMMQGESLHLDDGDVIQIDSGYRVGVNYSTDGGATYVWRGSVDGAWSVEYTGEYVLFIEQSDDITNVKKTESHVSIKRPNDLLSDLGEIQSSVNEITEIELTLFDGFYNSTGTVVEGASEEACKHTQKIKCFDVTKIRFNLSYLTSKHDMWIATCEWKKDKTFVRTSITSGNKINYTFDYMPTADVDEVSITFRGFNDYEFTAQSLTGIYAIYETLTRSTIDKNRAPVNYAFSEHLVKGINHRGYNTIAPENTIPAFKLSVEHGFNFVETDIRFTSDNIPVLLHDATVDRTSNGTGNIAIMTFAQARELDFGSWKSETYLGTKIPSFEEFILFCRNTRIFPYIEISGTYTAEQFDILVDIVKKYGMLNAVTWISFTTNNLKNIALRDATARLGQICEDPTEILATGLEGLRTGVNEVFVDANHTQLTNNGVTVCKNHDLQLEVWTINTAETVAALPSYVSGGTSDVVNFETIVREQAMT